MADKVIVSNRTALTAKYGADGLKKINAALKKLVAADKDRDLTTKVVFLDDPADMTPLGAPVVAHASNKAENKAAIDGVFAAITPDYLMILGSVDVIPHQDLANPLFDPKHPDFDEDQIVPSDLPYACEAPASSAIEDFIAPSRVVGRLPDITGANNPKYLLGLLSHAIEPVTGTSSSVTAFGLTAKVWQRSTSKTMRALFGNGHLPRTAPDDGPEWSDKELESRFHFINCHGDKRSSQFFGEPNDYPVAHDAAFITSRVKAGTVAAAECCYGAELYDPRGQTGQIGIGNTYLGCGSLAYFGSTTIAYGPATRNNYADVLCKLFIEEVLKGRSTGDAVLTARLRYAKLLKPIDAFDLKTLSQFILLGDPSIHPVRKSKSKAKSNGRARSFELTPKPTKSAGQFDRGAAARSARRRRARGEATVIEATAPVASREESTPSDVAAVIASRAASEGITVPSVRTFSTTVGAGGSARARSFSFTAAAPSAELRRRTTAAEEVTRANTRIHIAIGRSNARDGDRIRHPVAIVAQERNGQVTRIETIYGKSETRGARRNRR
jgi:hypothetical protein